MVLKSGTYIITSKSNGLPIGRYPHEDMSQCPKRVLALPKSTEAPKWNIKELNNSRYQLDIGGAPASNVNGRVGALLIPDERWPAEWTITPREDQGPNVYTVETNDPYEQPTGWVLPSEEPETQISVNHLAATKYRPLQFPSNELFVFEEC